MYTISYVSVSQGSVLYNELFLRHKCRVKDMNKHEALGTLSQFDSIFIEENRETDINEVCEFIMEVRKASNIPVWVMHPLELANKTKRIIYLQLGADGVIDVESDKDEFALMAKSVLLHYLRSKKTGSQTQIIYENGQIQLIPQNLSVSLEDGKEISLTKLEFLTIDYLHRHARQAVTYEEIYKNVWKDNARNRKYRVANLIFNLRKKIEKDVSKPNYIKTVRSKGYMLNI